MTGVDDPQRWAQAQRRAEALKDPAQRRNDPRALLTILLTGLVAAVVTAAVRILLPFSETEPAGGTDAGAPASPLVWIGLAITVAGLLLTVAVLVRALVVGRLLIVTSRVGAPLSGR